MGPMINMDEGCKRELYAMTMSFVLSLVPLVPIYYAY